MKEKILITGYNGALAKRLVHFLNDNYSLVFLSSSKKSVNNKDVFYWNTEEGYIDESALIGCQHIIHLVAIILLIGGQKKTYIRCVQVGLIPQTYYLKNANL